MPKKVMYLDFEDHPDIEFEFFLVTKLGLGTVDKLRREMSQREFMYWGMYYRRDGQRKELAALKAGS